MSVIPPRMHAGRVAAAVLAWFAQQACAAKHATHLRCEIGRTTRDEL